MTESSPPDVAQLVSSIADIAEVVAPTDYETLNFVGVFDDEEATGVDALLTGVISSITLTPAAFTDQRQASRYVLTLTANIEFKDLKTNKVLWSNPSMQFREEYDVTNTALAADPNAFFGQDVNALERLATEFARSVVSALLEAF